MNDNQERNEKNDNTKELERNGSLVYIEKENGNRDWVDYRDVDGWNC